MLGLFIVQATPIGRLYLLNPQTLLTPQAYEPSVSFSGCPALALKQRISLLLQVLGLFIVQATAIGCLYFLNPTDVADASGLEATGVILMLLDAAYTLPKHVPVAAGAGAVHCAGNSHWVSLFPRPHRHCRRLRSSGYRHHPHAA